MKKIIVVAVVLALVALASLVIAEEPKTEAAPAAAKAELIGQIEVKTIPAMKVAAVMEKAAAYMPEGGYKEGMDGAMAAYTSMMMHGFETLGAWTAAGNQPIGAPMAFFYEDPEKSPAKDLTCKIAFPCTAEAKATDKVMIEDLPEMQAVVAQYKGPYESSDAIWKAADKYAVDNGYEHAGAPCEVYLKSMGEKVPPAEYVTEIRIPVKKAEPKK